MTKTTLFLAGIAIVVLAGAGFMVYTSKGVKGTTQQPSSSTSATSGYGSFVGKIVSTSPDTSSVVVEISSSSTPAVIKIIKIDAATKIETIVTQKAAGNVPEKKLIDELNIADLKEGDLVTVVYASQAGSGISGVSSIQQSVTENIVDYMMAKRKADTSPYTVVKGKVASVDSASGKLSFYTYGFDVMSTTTQTITIPSGTPAYRVNDESLATIIHARQSAALADLKEGSIFFVEVEKAGFTGTITKPHGIIIIEK